MYLKMANRRRTISRSSNSENSNSSNQIDEDDDNFNINNKNTRNITKSQKANQHETFGRDEFQEHEFPVKQYHH